MKHAPRSPAPASPVAYHVVGPYTRRMLVVQPGEDAGRDFYELEPVEPQDTEPNALVLKFEIPGPVDECRGLVYGSSPPTAMLPLAAFNQARGRATILLPKGKYLASDWERLFRAIADLALALAIAPGQARSARLEVSDLNLAANLDLCALLVTFARLLPAERHMTWDGEDKGARARRRDGRWRSIRWRPMGFTFDATAYARGTLQTLNNRARGWAEDVHRKHAFEALLQLLEPVGVIHHAPADVRLLGCGACAGQGCPACVGKNCPACFADRWPLPVGLVVDGEWQARGRRPLEFTYCPRCAADKRAASVQKAQDNRRAERRKKSRGNRRTTRPAKD